MPAVIGSPLPFQVLQRHGAGDPTSADSKGHLGLARVTLAGEHTALDEVSGASMRAVPLVDAFGTATDWLDCELDREGTRFHASAEIPAGGWYRIELRLTRDRQTIAEADVSPVGIGEVFVIGGQSYMAGCHAFTAAIDDSLGRVTATSPELGSWRIAHDPQPAIVQRIDDASMRLLAEWARTLDLRFPRGESSPFRGSVWPMTMNHLLPLLGVPIGLVHVALGATTIAQWQPGGVLYGNLRDAVRMAGDHRAVLWGLGESDAASGTSTQAFFDDMRQLRAALVDETGIDRPWIVAATTTHPAYAANVAGENAIRAAVAQLWREPGFLPGPDTDILGGLGLHRADENHGGHFTKLGQERAALLWFSAIWHALATGLD